MAMRDLVPRSRTEAAPPTLYSEGDQSPFLRLRQQMDRLFDDMFRMPAFDGARSGAAWPSLEVKESDQDVLITAELPGMSDKDVELTVHDGMLAIKGERKSESEDRDRGWSERYYGRFERRIALPDGADEAHCDASFGDGVLSVRFPKSAEATRGRRIAINAQTRN